MTRNWKRKYIGLACIGLALVMAFAVIGCSKGGSDEPAGDDNPAAESIADLTVTPGVLTIATGDPAWEPWVMDDAPESGQGFEAALAYAVAEKMGYSADQVVWVRTGFDEAITPGATYNLLSKKNNFGEVRSPFNLYWGFAAGAEIIEMLRIEAGYDFGFCNLSRNDGLKIHRGFLHIGVGYLF